MTTQRLRIKPAYAAGEQIISLLYRLASRQLLPVNQMLMHLGFAPRRQTWRPVLRDIAIDPGPRTLAALHQTTGYSVEHLAAGTLASWVPGVYAPDVAYTADNYFERTGPHPPRASAPWRDDLVLWTGTHICPGCSREQPGRWPLAWRLKITPICSIHRCLLHAVCPSCQQRFCCLDGGTDYIPRIGYCNNAISNGERCAQKLEDLPRLPVTSTHTLEAVDLVNGLCAGSITLAHGQPGQTLQDIRAWMRLLVRFGTSTQLDRHIPGTSTILTHHRSQLRNRPKTELPLHEQGRIHAGVLATAVQLATGAAAADDRTALVRAINSQFAQGLTTLIRPDRPSVSPRVAKELLAVPADLAGRRA